MQKTIASDNQKIKKLKNDIEKSTKDYEEKNAQGEQEILHLQVQYELLSIL